MVKKTTFLDMFIHLQVGQVIEECFITFVAMSQLHSATMSEPILNQLYKMNLDVKSSLIGMGFHVIGIHKMNNHYDYFLLVFDKCNKVQRLATNVILNLRWGGRGCW